MTGFARVLAPVDFSEDSRGAVAVAFVLAPQGEVVILNVDPPPDLDGVERHAELEVPHILHSLQDHRRSWFASQFTELVTAVRGGHAGQPSVRGEMRAGDAVAEICRFAADWPAELMVIGTHGESGSTRFLFGSITAKVTRRAPCPVLVIRPRSPITRAPDRFHEVLVAVDYSIFSAPSAVLAASLLAPGGRLILLHVWQSPSILPLQFTADRQRLAIERLERFAAGLPLPAGVDVDCLVDNGSPAARILGQAERMNADLVVVGAHGQDGILENVVGTVADRVLRHAHAPVLLYPEGALRAATTPAPARVS